MKLRGNKNITQRYANRIVTGPAVEPVMLAELKLHLRITETDQDDYLQDSIVTARAEIEAVTGMAFITQTWKMSLDHWPGHREPWWDGARIGSINELYAAGTPMRLIQPTKFPLQSVDSLTVYDEDSNSTSIVVADLFDIDTQSWPGRIALQRGQSWPVALRTINAIEFIYTAGLGDTPADVNQEFKRAITLTAAYMYDKRGTCCSAQDAYTASGASSIMAKFAPVHI